MNESWYEWTALEHYNHTDEERLKKMKSKINVVKWGIVPGGRHAFDEERAPRLTYIKSYWMYFGDNRDLSIATKSKVFEAHIHNDEKRVTLIFPGTCSFTFEL